MHLTAAVDYLIVPAVIVSNLIVMKYLFLSFSLKHRFWPTNDLKIQCMIYCVFENLSKSLELVFVHD